MLQLAKDLEIFHLTRHAKVRKDRSSTSFSPPFALSFRQHRSSAVPRRLSLFLSLWHCYDIKHGGCTTAYKPAWIQHAFFCLTVLAVVVDARRTVDLFSQFGYIVGDGNHRSTCTGGLFGLCLAIGGSSCRFLVFDSLRPAHIACKPGKFLRKLLLRIYDRPLPISLSDRSHPAFVEALSYFLTEKVP